MLELVFKSHIPIVAVERWAQNRGYVYEKKIDGQKWWLGMRAITWNLYYQFRKDRWIRQEKLQQDQLTYMKKALEGDKQALNSAFDWEYTPQRDSFWSGYFHGKDVDDIFKEEMSILIAILEKEMGLDKPKPASTIIVKKKKRKKKEAVK